MTLPWPDAGAAVARALESYAALDAATARNLRLPADPAAYALGWIAAAAIVSARYADSAIDVIPVEHPEHGWDRFLLTRRTACLWLQNEPADAFGMLLLTGEDAPRLTWGNGDLRLSLGAALRRDPDAALAQLMAEVPHYGLVEGEHAGCPHHENADVYPRLYRAAATVIAGHPGTVGAREIFVDDQAVEGAYHPLYLHAAARQPQLVYDWLAVETPTHAAFVRTDGSYTVYETDTGAYSTVTRQIKAEDEPATLQRLLGWLRLEGHAPDPKGAD